jgi:hypothetical protein
MTVVDGWRIEFPTRSRSPKNLTRSAHANPQTSQFASRRTRSNCSRCFDIATSNAAKTSRASAAASACPSRSNEAIIHAAGRCAPPHRARGARPSAAWFPASFDLTRQWASAGQPLSLKAGFRVNGAPNPSVRRNTKHHSTGRPPLIFESCTGPVRRWRKFVPVSNEVRVQRHGPSKVDRPEARYWMVGALLVLGAASLVTQCTLG